MRKVEDLTVLLVPVDGEPGEHWHPEPEFDDCHVNVYCIDLEHRLCEFIRRAQFVVGCMAWLTNERVLAHLARVPRGCQIVVQKEDFLRPDRDGAGNRETLQSRYGALSCDFLRLQLLPGFVDRLSYCGDQEVQPVRCMGVVSRTRRTVPRMHHKFMVACDVTTRSVEDENGDCYLEKRMDPIAVWTGSFNATENGERSLENAVVIHSKKIAMAYAREWAHVLALSEPLDWNHEYVDPEWRVGS